MAMVLVAAADTRAQNPLTASTTAHFAVTAQTKLAVSAAILTFPNSDPDTVPMIQASEGGVPITASARNSGTNQVILSVVASDDLLSGVNRINISQLRWTGSGPGFVDGTMSKTTAQTAGLWTTSGSYSGTMTFALVNSWTYAVGTYGTTLTYTLSTP
jgi:hypothetical protein